ncbi:MAG TPA: glucosamine-6-phosphate deaminase [Clostridia bacterium]|nr:glucosamine-6-phosphate deaminase [Clostridia bacterium]
MGRAAALDTARTIRQLLEFKPTVAMVFAAAPSQDEFLEALAADPSVDFTRIIAFHMDEYVGLPEDAPQRFGNFLKDRLFGKVSFREVHYLDGNAPGAAECARYAALLARQPIDIVCMGIGENGHIAFNDPPVADFQDPVLVKCVALDTVCRMQQVHDGCFARLDDVPTHALTLTIPALMRADRHFCMVPAATKAEAVRRTVTGPIDTACPASILRTGRQVILYTDADSGACLRNGGAV